VTESTKTLKERIFLAYQLANGFRVEIAPKSPPSSNTIRVPASTHLTDRDIKDFGISKESFIHIETVPKDPKPLRDLYLSGHQPMKIINSLISRFRQSRRSLGLGG